MRGATAGVSANSVSGDVTLSDVSGDIRLRGLAGTAPVDALTVSGDVDASWPPTQGAELSLKTISGEVYADPAVTFSNLKTHTYVGYELHGHLGSNGPLVTLHSVSGDVFFRKQK